MNVKTFFKSVIATTTLAVTSFANAGYDVYHFYASGNSIIVTYDEAYVENPDKDTFDVVYDQAAATVTFTYAETYRDSETGSETGHYDYSCEIPSGHASFADAVELAENKALIQQFYVRRSPVNPPECAELDMIEYREATTTTVDFFCENGHTYWGQSVYVVGNTEALGNWNPANAVKLDAADYPTWSKALTVEADANIEWKCIKREESNPSQGVEWESGSNNILDAIEDSQTWGAF